MAVYTTNNLLVSNGIRIAGSVFTANLILQPPSSSSSAITNLTTPTAMSTADPYYLTGCLLNLANGNILNVYCSGGPGGQSSSTFVICMQQSSDGGKTWTPYAGTVYGGGTNGNSAQGVFYTKQGSANISASSVTSNVLKVTVGSALAHAFNSTQYVALSGLAETSLNGLVQVLASPAPTTTVFYANVNHADYTNNSETGSVYGALSSDFLESANCGGVVTPSGAIVIFWEDDTAVASALNWSCMMSRSTDNGATWSTPTQVVAGIPTVCPFAVVAGSGACPLYPSGAIFTTIQPFSGGALQYPKCYYSTDDGVTWTAAGILTAMPTNEIALAWVGGNTLVAFGRNNASLPVEMAYSKDMGATWTLQATNLGIYLPNPNNLALNYYYEISPCIINDNPGIDNVTLLWGERVSWSGNSYLQPNNGLRYTSFDPLAAIANPIGIPVGGVLDTCSQLGAVDAGYPSFAVSSGSKYLFQWMKQKVAGNPGISTAAFWQFFGTYSPLKVPTTVTSISPNNGLAAGGTSVTILGEGFAAGATVIIGGAVATSVVVVSGGCITCTTPAGSAGPANVVVISNGASTLTNGFTYSNFNPAFVASGVTPASGSNAVTLNTTGATLLVAVLSGNTGTAPTISDSVGGQSNAWNYLTTASQTDNCKTRIAYAYAKTGGGALQVGASHVFTPAGSSSPADTAAVVYAFSGTATDASVLDQSNATSNATDNTQGVKAVQAGSITPTEGALVIFGLGNNGTLFTISTPPSGFTGVLTQTSGANFEIIGACYQLNVPNSAINPTWSVELNDYTGAMIASFI